MKTPLCSACPVSERCPLRLSRPSERATAVEPGLEMLEFRKRDEKELGAILRTHSLIVRQGALKVVTEAGDIVKLVAGGDFFGPEVFFSGSPAVMIGAKSLMPELTVCALPHGGFESLMTERPSLNHAVIRSLAQQLMMTRLAFHWAKKSLRERAVLTLHHLRERFGVRYGQFRMIDIPLTKIDLASLMSTVQESAVRVLSEFREDGLISANGKRIVILDNARLDRLRSDIDERERTGAAVETEEAAPAPNNKSSY